MGTDVSARGIISVLIGVGPSRILEPLGHNMDRMKSLRSLTGFHFVADFPHPAPFLTLRWVLYLGGNYALTRHQTLHIRVLEISLRKKKKLFLHCMFIMQVYEERLNKKDIK